MPRIPLWSWSILWSMCTESNEYALSTCSEFRGILPRYDEQVILVNPRPTPPNLTRGAQRRITSRGSGIITVVAIITSLTETKTRSVFLENSFPGNGKTAPNPIFCILRLQW